MYELRPYQTQAKHETYRAWQQGQRFVIVVMPTGGGKTPFASEIIREHKGAACAIAHRQELVGQLSLALATQNVYHNLIASRATVKFISTYHTMELGRSFFHPQAPVAVAGVDTLIKRDLGSWAHQVTMWVQDEAHHLLMKANGNKPNKWGKAVNMFPNARGLGLTATPERADGKGLGRDSHGLFDHMVEGPTMRELIGWGNLTDYRLFAPYQVVDVTNVDVSQQTGDFNQTQLRAANHKSLIVGDVVEQYIKFAIGKRGVVFAVDVETATEIAQRFQTFGIRAEVVSAKTPDNIRTELISRLRRGDLDLLVNVDLFGEGFDLPAIEVACLARHTFSKSLAYQQFGRAMRPMEGKSHALIIDHVGNFAAQGGMPGRHSLPDSNQSWSLDARERGTRGKRDESVIPVTACQECMSVYERILARCPYCGHIPEPLGRSRPEQVDGDLFEMTPEALAQMRGDAIRAHETPEALKARLAGGGLAPIIVNSQVKLRRGSFDEHTSSLNELTESINYWGAVREMVGDSRQEAYRRFFHRFGVDVLTAQALPNKDVQELLMKVQEDY